MRISYNWLKQFIKIDWKSEEVAAKLTDLGLEVETIDKFQSIKGGLEGVVVGEVKTCLPHPDADRLKLTTVFIGNDTTLQIVCGAPNVAVGQKVAVATIGTTLYDNDDKPFKINKGKIRGQESFGMLCSESELKVGNANDGIMLLDSKTIPGTPLSKVLQIENDEVFEIGLTPNRADAMSHYGVARDIRAALLQSNLQIELITPSISNFRVDKRTLKIDVEIKDHKLCPRYCGITLSGVTVKPSPTWLQNRLKSIGILPKNNIVDATNYVLHELGQPLHAFDASKISGKIIVQTLTKNTKFTTLDDVERTLHEDDLMICDEKGPLCLAGIFGGKESGVTEKTTTIFLESAYFNPISIRKSAKRHNLNTDASFRFERGIDPAITEYALKRAALLIKEIAGGEVTSDVIEVYPKKIEDFSVKFNFDNATKIIGQELPKETIKRILASLDIKINSVSETNLGLVIPAYRVDVQREIDVIEEILRIYGYNTVAFSKKLHATVSNSPRTEDYKLQNITAQLLNSLGFNEMMSNSLTTPSYAEISSNTPTDQNVIILNPLSQDLSVMRQSLLYSGLEACQYNINRKNNDIKLFEFGKIYQKKNDSFSETKKLSLFLSGYTAIENWSNSPRVTNFFILKGYVNAILERLGITKYIILPHQDECFSEGLLYTINNEDHVEFGVIKKNILKHFDIKQDILYANINWQGILNSIATKIKFQDISKYPEVRRDLSLLLDSNISFQSLYELALQVEKNLLKSINLFDVYEGKNLPEGKKSYTISFTLQDNNKTLTDEQIEKIMTRLQVAFQSHLNATLR